MTLDAIFNDKVFRHFSLVPNCNRHKSRKISADSEFQEMKDVVMYFVVSVKFEFLYYRWPGGFCGQSERAGEGVGWALYSGPPSLSGSGG